MKLKWANSTGIYAHAMAAIIKSPDDVLMKGLTLNQMLHSIQILDNLASKKETWQRFLRNSKNYRLMKKAVEYVLSYNRATTELSIVDGGSSSFIDDMPP